MERRLRKERLRTRCLLEAVHLWRTCRRGWGNEEYHLRYSARLYKNNSKCSDEECQQFINDVEDEIFNILKTRYERQLEQKIIDVVDIDVWFDSGLDTVSNRLVPYLPIWHNRFGDKIVDGKKEKLPELALLASDSQNIHTKTVYKQTNTSIQLIEQVPVSKSQRTMDEILTAWISLDKDGKKLSTIHKDMLRFVNISRDDEKEEKDYLYRRVLRGLWAKIKTFEEETKKELINRLWEECLESVEMCYDGHVSRLTNVLVGFDEAFKTPISARESFQNAMSAISNSELSYEEKVAEATKAMNDVSMPSDERTAWLEAF